MTSVLILRENDKSESVPLFPSCNPDDLQWGQIGISAVRAVHSDKPEHLADAKSPPPAGIMAFTPDSD